LHQSFRTHRSFRSGMRNSLKRCLRPCLHSTRPWCSSKTCRLSRTRCEVWKRPPAAASGTPGMLEGTGVTVDQLRAFTDAAAAFFRAAPWRHMTNEDLIVAKVPQVPKAMRHLCVLGNAGEQFGIAFFESRQAFERIYSRAGFLPRRAFGVTYG